MEPDVQLRDLGLDGVASDFVEADPVVIAFLNEHCNLHRAVCPPSRDGAEETDSLGCNSKTKCRARLAGISLGRILDMVIER